jgi:signal recognition particle subunit SRP19
MKRRDGFIIWPMYFDASVSRSLYRRVPLSLSVKNPRAEQVTEAARRLGWSAVIEPGEHPAFWWRKTGKVIVNPGKPMKKSEVIRALAKAMKSGERSGL